VLAKLTDIRYWFLS